jgi:hypothetical protein
MSSAPDPSPLETPPPRRARGRRVAVLAALASCLALGAIVATLASPRASRYLREEIRDLLASKGENEASAIGALRTLNTAQALFREGDLDKNGVLDYASSLAELGAKLRAPLIDPALASGTRHGYTFTILQADRFTWSCVASPRRPGRTGDRYFFIDESGVIRFANSSAASSLSIPIGG